MSVRLLWLSLPFLLLLLVLLSLSLILVPSFLLLVVLFRSLVFLTRLRRLLLVFISRARCRVFRGPIPGLSEVAVAQPKAPRRPGNRTPGCLRGVPQEQRTEGRLQLLIAGVNSHFGVIEVQLQPGFRGTPLGQEDQKAGEFPGEQAQGQLGEDAQAVHLGGRGAVEIGWEAAFQEAAVGPEEPLLPRLQVGGGVAPNSRGEGVLRVSTVFWLVWLLVITLRRRRVLARWVLLLLRTHAVFLLFLVIIKHTRPTNTASIIACLSGSLVEDPREVEQQLVHALGVAEAPVALQEGSQQPGKQFQQLVTRGQSSLEPLVEVGLKAQRLRGPDHVLHDLAHLLAELRQPRDGTPQPWRRQRGPGESSRRSRRSHWGFRGG